MTTGGLTCCRPRIAPGPARSHAFHSAQCLEHAGEEIRLYPVPIPAPTPRNQQASMDVHPTSAVRAWRLHPMTCDCPDCRFVEFWIDRDDAEMR